MSAAAALAPIVGLLALLVAATGCQSPLERSQEELLRDHLLSTTASYRRQLQDAPAIEVTRTPSTVAESLTPERSRELDRISGPTSYDPAEIELGADLLGNLESASVGLTLEQAVRLAVQNNLNLQLARLTPGVTATQITQAEAVFDALFFFNVEYANTDTPRPASALGGFSGDLQSRDLNFATGIRKPLTTGGQVSIEATTGSDFDQPSFNPVSSFQTASIGVTLAQPLLRNFGQDVNRAQIEILKNTRAEDIEDLRDALLTLTEQVEQAYWNLVFARQQLLIRQRLLDRTMVDRNFIVARAEFDARPIEVTQANFFVDLRSADVTRARQAVRDASDVLKTLMNAPGLSVAGETMIVPLDVPVDASLRFSMVDAVDNAIRRRPDIQQALLQIDSASLRQLVADNLKLPRLDVSFTARFSGLGEDFGDAVNDVFDGGGNLDLLAGMEFEAPIGNRAAEGLYEQRQIERIAFAVEYQRRVQQAVLDIKLALREIITTYELIETRRSARKSAADNVRALNVRQEKGEELTPEFLDLRLRRQGELAEAEIAEIQALVDYNNAIAAFYRATGSLLERNGVEVAAPLAGAWDEQLRRSAVERTFLRLEQRFSGDDVPAE